MKTSRSPLAPVIIFVLLVACSGGTRSAVDNQTRVPTIEAMTARETTPPVPTTTAKPTVESTLTVKETEATLPTETPKVSEAEPEEPIRQASEEEISIMGANDLPLIATLYTPGGSGPAPGVILLHMLGSDRQVWKDIGLVGDLVAGGYVVLALDMRGHGDTGNDTDWNLVPEDMRLVWEYFSTLAAVDPQRTAIIGASIGANEALITGANEPAIETVILLSPGLDYRGVTTEEPLQRFGERPVLFIASEEDSYAADSSRTLADQALGESQLEMYNGAGHGTRMFSAQPELTNLILAWLSQKIN